MKATAWCFLANSTSDAPAKGLKVTAAASYIARLSEAVDSGIVMETSEHKHTNTQQRVLAFNVAAEGPRQSQERTCCMK